MSAREADFESLRESLRLAAKAANRGKAAQQEWPAFAERLKGLGYSPRAIARAFSTLSGAGTVAEALEVLRRPMPESHRVALSFEVTETRGGVSAANRVTITSVERDDSAIHVNYDVAPTPHLGSHRAAGEAKDDLGNDYRASGGHFGVTGSIDSTGRANTRAHGRLQLPLPPPAATALRIRIRWEASGVVRMPWDASPPSIWNTPADEVRVSLPEPTDD
jgi:hypothetical protein